MSEKIKDLSVSSFDSAINAGKPVLVDFWAPWCSPCRQLAPVLEDAAGVIGDTASICKVNIDDHSELATRYGIRAIPTLLFFKSGAVVEQITGARLTKDDIVSKLKSLA